MRWSNCELKTEERHPKFMIRSLNLLKVIAATICWPTSTISRNSNTFPSNREMKLRTTCSQTWFWDLSIWTKINWPPLKTPKISSEVHSSFLWIKFNTRARKRKRKGQKVRAMRRVESPMPSIDSSTETYLITLPTTTLNDKDTLQYVNNPITL